MVILLQNQLLTKSSILFVMLLISTTTLQPPTNGFYIAVSVHVSTVVVIMVLIIAKNPVTKPALNRTSLSFKRRGIVNQVIVSVVEDIFVMAKIIKVVENMNGRNLEGQTLAALLTVEFIALMEFGWPFAANIIPGVVLPMLTPLVFIIPPF